MSHPDTAARIGALLRERLSPQQLEIRDDSAAHAGHGAAGGHFRVRVVSTDFRGLKPLARHRLVNALLAPLYASEVHALTLETLTPEESTLTTLSN
jgi:BolA protein